MSTKNYLQLVENTIKKRFGKISIEVIQVWYCKTIQNHKGLFIMKDVLNDLILEYFIEATYNGDKNELYLDFYSKRNKIIVKCIDNE